MRVIWRDGETYEGLTAEAVVAQMRKSSRFTADKSNERYMATVAERFWKLNEQAVDTSNEERFLADLERVGAVKLIETEGGVQ